MDCWSCVVGQNLDIPLYNITLGYPKQYNTTKRRKYQFHSLHLVKDIDQWYHIYFLLFRRYLVNRPMTSREDFRRFHVKTMEMSLSIFKFKLAILACLQPTYIGDITVRKATKIWMTPNNYNQCCSIISGFDVYLHKETWNDGPLLKMNGRTICVIKVSGINISENL